MYQPGFSKLYQLLHVCQWRAGLALGETCLMRKSWKVSRIRNGQPAHQLLQLVLEQHLFELHRSTYMQIFYNSKHYSTTHSLAVESEVVELQNMSR